eukprot:GEMP01013934.1.p1 GENE.GEMP01013934.1~~GEMP01013934.1.p1  ORF type:complete len:590 (+),score=139.90 GEMP01013934.1:90-1859(+)
MLLVHHWDLLPEKTKAIVTRPLDDGTAFINGRKIHLSLNMEEGIIVTDGPLKQPLADYITDSGKNQEYDVPERTSALDAISARDRTSFEEVFPSDRKEAMKVAVLEADTREALARKVLDLKPDLGKPPKPNKAPAKNAAKNRDSTCLFGTPKLRFEPLWISQRLQKAPDQKEVARDRKTEVDVNTASERETWFSPVRSPSNLIPSLSPLTWARSRPNQQSTTQFQPPEWATTVIRSPSPQVRSPQISTTRPLPLQPATMLLSHWPASSPYSQSPSTELRSVRVAKSPQGYPYSKCVPASPGMRPPRRIFAQSPSRATTKKATQSPHSPTARQTIIAQSPEVSSMIARSPQIAPRAVPVTQIRSWTSLPSSPNLICLRSESSPQLVHRVAGKGAKVPLRTSMPHWKEKQTVSNVADPRSTAPPSVSLNNGTPPAQQETTTTGITLFGQRIQELEIHLSIERQKNAELEAANEELRQKQREYETQLKGAQEAHEMVNQRDLEKKELEEKIEMIWRLLDDYLVEKGDISGNVEEGNGNGGGTVEEKRIANGKGTGNGKEKRDEQHVATRRPQGPRSLRDEMWRRIRSEDCVN